MDWPIAPEDSIADFAVLGNRNDETNVEGIDDAQNKPDANTCLFNSLQPVFRGLAKENECDSS
jgi:hypothetical protein